MEKELEEIAKSAIRGGVWNIAFQAIGQMKEPLSKSRTLLTLAVAQARRGAREEANASVEQAATQAGRISSDPSRNELLQVIDTARGQIEDILFQKERWIEKKRRRERPGIVGSLKAEEGAFYDRIGAMEEMRRWLADASVGLINVVGPEEIGKTALAARVCSEIETRSLVLTDSARQIGADGLLYIDGNSPERPTVGSLLEDLGALAGGKVEEELRLAARNPALMPAEKAQQARRHLASGCYLIVCDNLDPLLTPEHRLSDTELEDFLAALLISPPHVLRLILISREAFLLPGLAAPHGRLLRLEEGLPIDDAVSLLSERLPSEKRAVLRAIAEGHKGIPGALRRVSAQILEEGDLTSTGGLGNGTDANSAASKPKASKPWPTQRLTEIILENCHEKEVEEFLAAQPETKLYRGETRHRLSEYLTDDGEDQRKRNVLLYLFRPSDLQNMTRNVGNPEWASYKKEETADALLEALGFNLSRGKPNGLTQSREEMERLRRKWEALVQGEEWKSEISGVVASASIIGERIIKDLIRCYSQYFFGDSYEETFSQKNWVPKRDGRPKPWRDLTAGELLSLLETIEAHVRKSHALHEQYQSVFGREFSTLPKMGTALDGDLRADFLKVRGDLLHDGDVWQYPDFHHVREQGERLIQVLTRFFDKLKEESIYPWVLCYSRHQINRHGEKLVYCHCDDGIDRKIRTDENLDPRRFYWCLIFNNPIPIQPIFIVKD